MCKQKRLKQAACLFLVVLLTTAGLFTGTRAAEAENDTGVYGKVNAVLLNADTRLFKMEVSAWSDLEFSGETVQSGTVLVMDVSDSMICLADPPSEEHVYKANVHHKSIDETGLFYTRYEEEYRPVGFKDGKWFVFAYNAEGVYAATDIQVGVRKAEEEITDLFTYDIYEKGSLKTKLDYAKEAASSLVSELAAVSPASKFGIVFYNGKTVKISARELGETSSRALNDSIAGCDTYLAAGAKNVTALEEADRMLQEMKKDGIESLNLINLTGSACDAEDNPIDQNVQKIQTLMQGIKESGIKVFSVGAFAGGSAGEDTTAFLEAIASKPLEQYCTVTAPSQLMQVFSPITAMLCSGTSVTVMQVVDPRFTLTDGQKQQFVENNIPYEEKNDGTTVIDFAISFPKSRDMPWESTFEIQAKADFPGGNNIPLLTEESGIYRLGSKLYGFNSIQGNVPFQMQLADIEADIFLGQRIPTVLEGVGIEELIQQQSAVNWYGKGETCAISLFWQEETGGKIGKLEQLKEIKPGESSTYLLKITCEPGNDGKNAVGTPLEKKETSAQYNVNVITGSIRVKMTLGKHVDFNTLENLYVFKLQCNSFVQYKAINLNNRSEDGEGLSLEALFTGLPYGDYTLTQSSGIPGQNTALDRVTVCKIGLSDSSDKVDIANNSFVLLLSETETGGDDDGENNMAGDTVDTMKKRITKSMTNAFEIDLS